MNLRKSLTGATFTIFIALSAFAKTSSNGKISSGLTEIQNYNYICMNTTKPEALVFKTTTPNRIWRTTIGTNGEIKKGKAFELSNVQMNASAINIEGRAASFKAELAKNYEIKGIFQKGIDEDLPLTVISTYVPEGKLSQTKDHYNCSLEKSDAPSVLLGSAE